MALPVVNQEAARGHEPEAWLPQRDGTKLFSFGGGHRVCLGQVFARLEANVVLSEIVRRFDIQAVSDDQPTAHTEFSSAPAQEQYMLRPLSQGLTNRR